MANGEDLRLPKEGKAHGFRSVGFSLLAASVFASGCTKPSQANIALRKENETLTKRVDQLETMRKADSARRGVTTSPSSPGAIDLDAVYTAHSMGFGRLTGVTGNVLKVYVTPTDQVGDDLKSAGGFEVTAVDAARGANALVGQWTFTPEQARKAWSGKGMLYTYVLECPIAGATPEHELTVRVVFRETLTGRTLEAETKARIFKQ